MIHFEQNVINGNIEANFLFFLSLEYLPPHVSRFPLVQHKLFDMSDSLLGS